MYKQRAVKPMIGNVYGFLTVISFEGINENRCTMWKARCVCGVEKVFRRHALVTGNSKSCGCKKIESSTSHGHCKGSRNDPKRKTPTYNCWNAMRHRCNNPSNKHYEDYGGRGIKVCERWDQFENFLADMGPKPQGLSIDRIKNDLGYFKENCRWISLSEQQQNKRNNRFLTIDGRTECLAQWGREKKINPLTLSRRIDRGVPIHSLFDPTS